MSEPKRQRRDCPYLDTVNRSVLDFDFEKVCSVTLSKVNVYACLVCCRFFKGRGESTPARTHALQADHHVFLNFATQRVYCLPDDYEVIDSSLDDIKRLIRPVFTVDQVARIDSGSQQQQQQQQQRIRCVVGGGEYLPGFIGLNNLTATDSFNSVAQALAHVRPLREYFLLRCEEDAVSAAPPAGRDRAQLLLRFGELIRKIWSPFNFKGQVSPSEVLQAVMESSSKRFKIGTPFDPLDFLQWFLNELTSELSAGKTASRKVALPTIIQSIFQGEVEITTTTPKRPPATQVDEQGPGLAPQPRGQQTQQGIGEEISKVSRSPFLHLQLDLPPMPLFKEGERTFIPQVPLMTLLQKFNGRNEQPNVVTGELKRFCLTRLPPFLIVHIKRFTFNNWFLEKNTTIVNFPLKHLDLRDCVHPDALSSVGSTKYDLVASIRHEGASPDSGSYSVFVHTCGAAEQWYEIQDLVVRETIPQLITVSEAYIQIYEHQGTNK